MTEIIRSLDEIDRATARSTATSGAACTTGCAPSRPRSRRSSGSAPAAGAVVLLTNSPRPAGDVARQLDLLGAPRSCWDAIVSSGDAAQAAMAAGQFGRRVYHIGPERDLGVLPLRRTAGRSTVERVPLEEAEGIVCTGLFDDRSETPDDYRATILYGKTKGLKLLCANPDVVVDVGDRRIYCAGAIAAGLCRRRRAQLLLRQAAPADLRAGARSGCARSPASRRRPTRSSPSATASPPTSQGAMGEGLDALFVTGGLRGRGDRDHRRRRPRPGRLAAYLAAARLEPKLAMAYLR